jgi:catechol 2,3-dioxygenase-like lactoylglutathione lyase family enzyme
MPPKLGPLHEVILYVSNMIGQISFYRDTLGLEVAYPDDLGDGSEASWVVFDTGQCSLALHAGGEKRIGEDAPKIVFQVDDIEAVRDDLISRDVPMSEIVSPAPGIRVSNGRDPEGNAFSIESISH